MKRKDIKNKIIKGFRKADISEKDIEKLMPTIEELSIYLEGVSAALTALGQSEQKFWAGCGA